MPEENTEQNNAKFFYYLKSIIWALVIVLLCVLAYLSFFGSKEHHEISKQFLAFCSLIVFACLAALFDEASFGNVIKLKRDIKNAKKEKEASEKKVEVLQDRLFNISINSNSNLNTQSASQLQASQSHVNVNVSGIGVQPATKEEKAEAEAKDTSAEQEVSAPQAQPQIPDSPKVSQAIRKLNDQDKRRDLLVNKFLTDNGFKSYEFDRNIKITQNGRSVDKICTRVAIFDAYSNQNNKEIFIYVQGIQTNITNVRNSLYWTVNQLNSYRLAKGSRIELVILMMSELADSVREYFAPLINEGVLKVLDYSEVIDDPESTEPPKA